VLLGLAGGLFVIAGGLVAGYYVVATRSEAHAATPPPVEAQPVRKASAPSPAIAALLDHQVAVVVSRSGSGGVVKLAWKDLGVEIDPDEAGRASGDVARLAAKAEIPVRVDRDKAATALRQLKAKYDTAGTDAFLDLEERAIRPDSVGHGIDVWASLPRIETAARQNADSVELATVELPARVTKATLGIDDISHVMGHYKTQFPVTDRDRNFNLKLAASKINGTVLKPGEKWSFNTQVGERSEKEGYKIAHVITAGEMVDGLAGGTCQISTTLFGAAFFAGLDIPDTTNHSRPSAYTPLGFDETVVWPNTDLVLKNPYDFPVVLHYRVANGEAIVEVLGKQRPWDRVVFRREMEEMTQYEHKERNDDKMPDGQTVVDQEGFNGYKLKRFREFWKKGTKVKEQKWTVRYKPVTEYLRRGTSKDPDAEMPPDRDVHSPFIPSSDDFKMAQ
jgi:vancomycin resistance protein YoaR